MSISLFAKSWYIAVDFQALARFLTSQIECNSTLMTMSMQSYSPTELRHSMILSNYFWMAASSHWFTFGVFEFSFNVFIQSVIHSKVCDGKICSDYSGVFIQKKTTIIIVITHNHQSNPFNCVLDRVFRWNKSCECRSYFSIIKITIKIIR